MHFIDIPDHIADKLSDLPVAARTGSFERAINRALDAVGWPATIQPAVDGYWYVNLWTADGALIGHVGPIVSRTRANRTADSWRSSANVRVSRYPLGEALTNAFQ